MSTSDSLLLEVLSQIGEVQNALGVVQGQNVLILAEQGRGADSRRGIHEKLGSLAEDIQQLNGRVGTVEGDVKRVVPLVDALETARIEKVGQGKLITKGRLAVGAGVSAGVGIWHQWEAIRDAVSKLFK
jgi:hypothetical protein